mgnify:CR=1 FL=1
MYLDPPRRSRARVMRPGECRVTRKGVKYCYIAGKGVRFVGK